MLRRKAQLTYLLNLKEISKKKTLKAVTANLKERPSNKNWFGILAIKTPIARAQLPIPEPSESRLGKKFRPFLRIRTFFRECHQFLEADICYSQHDRNCPFVCHYMIEMIWNFFKIPKSRLHFVLIWKVKKKRKQENIIFLGIRKEQKILKVVPKPALSNFYLITLRQWLRWSQWLRFAPPPPKSPLLRLHMYIPLYNCFSD